MGSCEHRSSFLCAAVWLTTLVSGIFQAHTPHPHRVHWPDYVVLFALLVTLVISETVPPVQRRIYHVGPDGATSALETWQCVPESQFLFEYFPVTPRLA